MQWRLSILVRSRSTPNRAGCVVWLASERNGERKQTVEQGREGDVRCGDRGRQNKAISCGVSKIAAGDVTCSGSSSGAIRQAYHRSRFAVSIRKGNAARISKCSAAACRQMSMASTAALPA